MPSPFCLRRKRPKERSERSVTCFFSAAPTLKIVYFSAIIFPKNFPHSSVTAKASAENGIRSVSIRYRLLNSLLVSSLPNTARLFQLFLPDTRFPISNSPKLSCCHSLKEPTTNRLSQRQNSPIFPSAAVPKSIRIYSYFSFMCSSNSWSPVFL